MMRRAVRIGGLVVACCLGFAWPSPARAQEDAAAAPDAESLPVSLELVSTKLQAADIETALASELGVPVRVTQGAAQKGLAISVKWRRVTVRFTNESGETTSRSLDLPANGPRSLEIIALLAGNLARDEASELLARLAPPEPPPTEEPADPAKTDAAPTEAPKAEAPKPKPAEKKAEPKPAAKKPARAKRDTLIRDEPSLNLSLYHPVTLLSQTERRVLNVEGGLAYSRLGALEGGALTLGYLRVEEHMSGFSTTVGWNRVGGNASGVMFSAIGTEGHGRLRGFESAGVLSLRWGDVEGAQASGVLVRADDVYGFQGAAVGAWARDVHGAQMSIVSAARDVAGAQVSLVGVAREVDGAQVSLVSVANDAAAQLALVNVARRADFQLGLVNIADQVDGAAFGLVSVAGNGRVQPFVASGWLGPNLSSNLGVRFVVGYGYSQLSVGEEHDDTRSRIEGGAGFRWEHTRDLPIGGIALEAGAHYSNTFTGEERFTGPEVGRLHYRGGLHLMLFKPLWVMGGVDVSHEVPIEGDTSLGAWGGIALF